MTNFSMVQRIITIGHNNLKKILEMCVLLFFCTCSLGFQDHFYLMVLVCLFNRGFVTSEKILGNILLICVKMVYYNTHKAHVMLKMI